MPQERSLHFTPEVKTVKQRMMELIDFLALNSSATFGQLFVEDRSRGELIITFLALLEMCKLRLIRISQHFQSGIIRIFYL